MEEITQIVVPEVPKVIPNEQLYVYMPIANGDNPGMVSYDSDYFTIVNGILKIKHSAYKQLGVIEGTYQPGETITDFSKDILVHTNNGVIENIYLKQTINNVTQYITILQVVSNLNDKVDINIERLDGRIDVISDDLSDLTLEVNGFDSRITVAENNASDAKDVANEAKTIANEAKQIAQDNELFYCTYGTTTYNQISQAVSAGKLPVCKYGDILYKYSYKAPSLQGVPMIYFTELHSDRGMITSKSLVVNQSDNWFETNVRLQTYINADNKLNADFVKDANSTHKFVTSTEKSQITTNANDISIINLKIPSSASSSNKMTVRNEVVGSVDLSINSSTYVITLQCKDVNGNNLGSAKTIDLPLESVVVSGSYNSTNKKVVLTLQDGSTIEFSVADLVSGLQTEITSNNKLSSDLVDDTNQTHKFVSSTDISNWNAKSTVSVSSTGTATDEVNYITINGVEKKIGGSGGSGITNYEVINRPNVLPTATATSPDFVQYNGKLYRKQVSSGVPSVVTDLTGTSWELNNSISISPSGWSLGDDSGRDESFYINFTFVYQSLTTNANYIRFHDLDSGPDVIVFHTGVNSPEVYSFFTGWLSPIYKNINITGGTDVTNSTLISWLQANATMQPTTTYEYVEVAGGGSTTWGSITGTLSNQTDLKNALNGKQSKITSSHKLSSGLVDDSQSSNKFVTISEKNAWSGKQDAITSSNKLSADNVDDTSTTNKFVTTSDKNTWNGKQDAITTTLVGDGTLDKVIGFNNNGELVKGTPSATAGVSSLGGATGAITLGTGLNIANNVLSASGGVGALAYDLLWTNQYPSQTFNSQSVTPTNLNNYELINIVFADSKTQLTNLHNKILSKGAGGALIQEWFETSPDNKRVARERSATFKTDGNVSFGKAYWWHTRSDEDNAVIIPLYIYGIK